MRNQRSRRLCGPSQVLRSRDPLHVRQLLQQLEYGSLTGLKMREFDCGSRIRQTRGFSDLHDNLFCLGTFEVLFSEP